MRADRLISILMLLQTKGQMTAQELAQRLEVSTRTIYRDLDALSGAGVPVYAERGPNGGCMLMESYRTNLTGLKEQEVRALFMFTVPGLMADLGVDKASEAAMLKLTAALPAPFQQDVERVRERIYLDPAAWFQPAEPTPYLSMIQQALWQQRRVRIDYRRGDGQWVKRLVEPYGLVAKTSLWYMVCGISRFAPTESLTVYRISRIQQAELTEYQFERPSHFDLATYWHDWCQHFEQSHHTYPVTLRVTPVGIPTLVRIFGDSLYTLMNQAAPADDDGRLTLSLTFDSLETACEQLLGLGTDIEVITPQSLREHMRQTAVQIAACYSE